jgi:ribosomal protein S6-L-glutamate ligase RimK-like protein
MLYLNIAEGCGPTGNILRDLLRERGVEVSLGTGMHSDSVVCWGNGYTGRLPSLNRNATQFDKLRQLQVLASAESHNLRTVPFQAVTAATPPPPTFFPAFMRRLSHTGGTDIRVVLEPEHAGLFARNGWAFATKYVPNQKEFRIWAYRRQMIGAYEKTLARPSEFLASRRYGANFDNGYAFTFVPSDQVAPAARELATAAVNALGLDFGAVDMLLGRDGHYYILEVNTAPGVEGPDRVATQALADKIVWWVNHNYPRRNGDEAAYERPNTGRREQPATRAAAATAEASMERPSFLPRPGESWQHYVTRINA